MDAIVKGTTAGLELLLNIVAMLMVLVALVYLANAILGLLPHIGGAAISLQRMLGYAMAPVCWLMGLPWPQAVTAGSLMGVKTVLNELIAYVDLSKLGPDALDPRSRLIMLYPAFLTPLDRVLRRVDFNGTTTDGGHLGMTSRPLRRVGRIGSWCMWCGCSPVGRGFSGPRCRARPMLFERRRCRERPMPSRI
jgi:hypothetical protein